MDSPTTREIIVWLRACAATYEIHGVWAQMLNAAADKLEKPNE